MARVLIIADDLTGANDSAAQFAVLGARTMTLLDSSREGQTAELRPHCQVLSLSTESRNIGATRAANAVSTVLPAALSGFGADVLFKKLDSTLRGNVEAELAVCAEITGVSVGAPIILTPAYPENRRVVSGGYVLVDGVPLARTFAGRDALAPVSTSRVLDVFSRWQGKAGELTLSALEGGEDSLRQSLLDFRTEGRDLVLCDALEQRDLDLLVRVAFPLYERVLWAGSAGLARALACYLTAAGKFSDWNKTSGQPVRDNSGSVLALYGSLNPASLAQVDHARQRGSCTVVYAPDNLDVCETLAAINGAGENVAVVSANACASGSPEEASGRVNAYFAQVARMAAKGGKFSSMVLCGGDTARAVLAGLGVSAVTIEAEVLPGVVLARAYDGTVAGMGLVTKAGGFGGADTLCEIIEWLGMNVSLSRNG